MTVNTYLLGDALESSNWGNQALTKGGCWAPLELVVAPKYRARFMFMEIVESVIDEVPVNVYLYKHSLTNEYVNVDAEGNLYQYASPGYRRISVEEARSCLVGNLVRMLEDHLDINYDLGPALEKLASLTGLSFRTTER